MSELLRARGRLAESEQAHREALAIRRAAFGDDHVEVAASHNNLGELLAKKGAYAEAEASFRTALDGWRSALGADHPTVAFALLGLGRMMHTQGRCGEAEPLLREALREQRGEDHDLTRRSRTGLARLYRGWGRPEQALVYAR